MEIARDYVKDKANNLESMEGDYSILLNKAKSQTGSCCAKNWWPVVEAIVMCTIHNSKCCDDL